MNSRDKEYLKTVLNEMDRDMFEKLSSMQKSSQGLNVMENSMWSNMIDGALVALETVSVLSLDWKLIGIVKLLQSWIKDRREEAARKELDKQYDSGYQSEEYDPWSNTTY